MTLTAHLFGGAGSSVLAYNWAVSNGKIISGQNTRSIKVDTDGLRGQVITATVIISGPQCATSAISCRSSILPAAQPCRKLDEYGNIRYDDEKVRLDNFAFYLQSEPNTMAYIIGHAAKGTRGNIQTRLKRAKNWLVATQRIDAERINTTAGPTQTDLSLELWICPPGAKPR